MHTKLKKSLALGALLPLLAGCIDKGYDLSDIDTTTELKVENLTIPVNLETVTLGDIITYDDNSKIRPFDLGNGQRVYALNESGTFHSDPIEIAPVSAQAPVLRSTESVLEELSGVILPPGVVAEFNLDPMGNEFSYLAAGIDPALVEITQVQVSPITFSVKMQALGVAPQTEAMYFSDVHLQLPRGLRTTGTHEGTYDPATGIWSIPTHNVSNWNTTISITADAITFGPGDAAIENGNFRFNGSFRLIDGKLTIAPKAGEALPGAVPFRIDYTLGNLRVNAISGVIDYVCEGLNINDINLGDIPDFLQGDETNLVLGNPQIYIRINNPVAPMGLHCQGALELTAIRGTQATPFVPEDATFTLAATGEGPYNFVYSPSGDDLATPAAYAPGLQWHRFSSLGHILSGTGLPSAIGVAVPGAGIPRQRVDNFRLGQTIGSVEGSYDLIAPLELGEGSHIVYTTREDGWNDPDVDAITISELTLRCTATNNTPLDAEVTVYPLGADGQRIPGVVIQSNRLAAGASAPLEFHTQGTIRHLDGVDIVATVEGGQALALSPDQTITLGNIRVTVSGNYTKEL